MNVVFVVNEAFSDVLNEDVFVFPGGRAPMEVYNSLAAGRTPTRATSSFPYFAGGTADTEFDVATGMQTNLLNPRGPSLTAFRTVNRGLDSIFRVFAAGGYSSCFSTRGRAGSTTARTSTPWLGADESLFCRGLSGA